ncbi:MAG: hypothetical protein HS127_09320 [Planctomycetia bacterium]|nr:hypothetical protein [Planctomycetia bacterium]
MGGLSCNPCTREDFVDSSIFRYSGKWWMFTSDTTNSNCYLYYSDNNSGWVEHPMSPIINGDANRARLGEELCV